MVRYISVVYARCEVVTSFALPTSYSSSKYCFQKDCKSPWCPHRRNQCYTSPDYPNQQPQTPPGTAFLRCRRRQAVAKNPERLLFESDCMASSPSQTTCLHAPAQLSPHLSQPLTRKNPTATGARIAFFCQHCHSHPTHVNSFQSAISKSSRLRPAVRGPSKS